MKIGGVEIARRVEGVSRTRGGWCCSLLAVLGWLFSVGWELLLAGNCWELLGTAGRRRVDGHHRFPHTALLTVARRARSCRRERGQGGGQPLARDPLGLGRSRLDPLRAQ
jgi:hypothetical protein